MLLVLVEHFCAHFPTFWAPRDRPTGSTATFSHGRDGDVRWSSYCDWSPVQNGGPQQKKFGKMFFSKQLFFSVVRVYACHGALSSPQVRMSPGRDPLLPSLLVGVRIEHGVNAGHGEHHIPVCGLFCTLVDDVALCLSLIRRAYAFRFSGDRRDFILLSPHPTFPKLLGRVTTVYVVPSHIEGRAKGAT